MASSSTSSIHKTFKYDVFLSFRGLDTRTNFVDHLYHALQQKSIHTYKDDERIKKGNNISDEIIDAIKDSKFYIIVFSKNYASSPWCLDELVEILEFQKTTEHTAYTIFYDVEPSEIRNQKGAVAEAFDKHENQEASVKWRKALKEAADLAGWELKKTADGHEAKLIQKVVEELSLDLRSFNFNTDEKLVGMDTRIKDFVSSLGIGFGDVRMIGIKGMGGGGKTTLARAIFDLISFRFEGKSFIENVREKASLYGLNSIQKQVFSDVLNEDIRVSSAHEGKYMMKRRMCAKKVLFVLDDVDHIDQLEALADELTWFKPGSRIIITTRDEQVLVAHHVEFIHDVSLLSDEESISLFNTYAFRREIQSQGYKEISTQVVRYAAGLPLTIKVLGSFLCGKNELECVDALERLKKIPLAETLKKLELSYTGLEDDYREIFLDVACILKGWEKDNAIKALESCGFHARLGLKVLQQKSLITINRNYYGEWVDMHDHLEEMGKNIVRRSHPNMPHKHSRLWIHDEVEDILANDLGTKATRCIRFHDTYKNFNQHVKGLRKMKKLRILSVREGYFCNLEVSIVGPEFPNALQYLCWECYPFNNLPKTFQANNLVALEITNSNIEHLWEGGERKVLNKLRFLNLSRSILSTFDFRLTPNLEKLTLQHCYDLVELNINIECLKLIYVDLKGSRLRTLDLGLAPNLEELVLVKCKDLKKLHLPRRCINLRCLLLTHTKVRTLDIGLSPNLKKLDLQNSYCLEELHMNECQKLTKLKISHSMLRTLDLGLTPNIETLDIKECDKLVEIFTPIGWQKQLVHVDLSGCLRFKSFSFQIKNNSSCSVDESIVVGPIAKLNLFVESLERCRLHPDNNLPSFRFDCVYKEDRPSFTRNLEMLFSVGMCACTNLEKFSGSICGLQRLRSLKLRGSFLEAFKDFDRLECLEELILVSTTIDHLPDSICMMKHLKHLELRCRLLEKLPDDLGRLDCLEELDLAFTKIKHLPGSICMLKSLKSLDLYSCSSLEKLPEDLGRLQCLEELTLVGCELLQYIPNSICEMKCLKGFDITNCIQIENLPEEFGHLESLEAIGIKGTSISHLPRTIHMLKGLDIIGSKELVESYGLTSEIQTKRSKTFGHYVGV